jgi:purine-binding chemotaxis protein CheW
MTRFAQLLENFFYDPAEDAGVLMELPDPHEGDAPGQVEERPREHLAFWLGKECYAVEIDFVREIVRVPPLTEVPRSTGNLLGVMNLRGEVLPVYDIKPRLRLASRLPVIAGPEADPGALPRGARIIVLRLEDGDAGILVDSVAEVVRLLPSQIEPPPAGVGSRDCVLGLGRRKDQLCILLDVKRVLQ